MRTFRYTVKDPHGIHARPAGVLAKKAQEYASEIVIEKDGKSVNAERLMAVMGLCVRCGDTVTVTVTGEDEAEATAALEAFFKEHF